MSQSAFAALKYRKRLPSQRKRDQLVLFSLTSLKRFSIYNDVEVGVPESLQNTLLETAGDEDYDSSEEVITLGVNRCMKILTTELSQTEPSLTESEKDSPNTQSPSPALLVPGQVEKKNNPHDKV